jgi:hypothetical protein
MVNSTERNTTEESETQTHDVPLSVPDCQRSLAEKETEIAYLREQLSLAQQNHQHVLNSRQVSFAHIDPNASAWHQSEALVRPLADPAMTRRWFQGVR